MNLELMTLFISPFLHPFIFLSSVRIIRNTTTPKCLKNGRYRNRTCDPLIKSQMSETHKDSKNKELKQNQKNDSANNLAIHKQTDKKVPGSAPDKITPETPVCPKKKVQCPYWTDASCQLDICLM